jgi:hypothetical protein
LAAHPDAPLVHRRAIMRSLIHTSLASGRIDVARELLASTGDGTALGHRDLLVVATIAYASDEYRVVDECAALAGPLLAGDRFGVELAFRHVRSLRHRCEFGAAHQRLDAIAELAAVEHATMAALQTERGMTLAMEARTDEAREALARARETLGRLGIDRGLGACWAYEAWCDLADGRVRRARPALDRSRTIAASLTHRADVAFTEVLLARLHLIGRHLVASDLTAADTEAASTLATAALDHFRLANDRLGTARALEVLADADEIRFDEDRSVASASEAEWLRAQIGTPASPLERAVAAATVRG